jgi:hypothetical protein
MSKLETPLIREYWKQVGGTLVEEFPVVKPSKDKGRRVIDAIIIPNGDKKILKGNKVSLKGKDIICVQAKKRRLSMSLMGQTFFSQQLLKGFKPKSIMSVALCTEDDSVLRPLLEHHSNM